MLPTVDPSGWEEFSHENRMQAQQTFPAGYHKVKRGKVRIGDLVWGHSFRGWQAYDPVNFLMYRDVNAYFSVARPIVEKKLDFIEVYLISLYLDELIDLMRRI